MTLALWIVIGCFVAAGLLLFFADRLDESQTYEREEELRAQRRLYGRRHP